MRIGIVKESHDGERRVAIAPVHLEKLSKLGFELSIESGAGVESSFPDSAYEEAGASLVDADEAWSADIVLKVRPPTLEEVDRLKEGGTLICHLWPAQNEELVAKLAEHKTTSFSLDCVPRISRAQSMDVLSSMANIAGYRAVLEAGNEFGRFFGGQMTAAGSCQPARVMVIGAGVAGLAAIACAKNLGAIVSAFDTRPAVKEQVESLGGKFLELEFEEEGGETAGGYAKVMSKEFIEAEMALFKAQAPKTDIIITTALIPGRPAPKLILEEHVNLMKPGSVIVDLAAEQGGNCEVTVPGVVHDHNGVKIIGYTDLTSRLPTHASQFFGSNLVKLLGLLGGAEDWNVDLEDEIIRGSIVTQDGEVLWPPPERDKPVAPAANTAPAPEIVKHEPKQKDPTTTYVALGVAAVAVLAVGMTAPPDFVQHFSIFVLACFVGWQVVWNVTAALHTPLMSVTNAISGIIIVGGVLQATGGFTLAAEAGGGPNWAVILGAVAILVAAINIVGGFVVTQRMLQMFRK